MPELPEVEGAARLLHEHISGRVLRGCEWMHASLARTVRFDTAILIGQRVTGVGRVAKWQEVRFANGTVLVVHFRMTGDWAFTARLQPPPYARAHFHFSGARHVWLVDPRVLARLTLRAPDEPADLTAVGPDALDPTLDAASLRARFDNRRAPIKQVLLDQSVLAGLGNIYAAEALWHARIHPATPAQQLNRSRVLRLLDGIRWTLQLAFDGMGRHQYGEATDRFAVYDREGLPCPRCSHPISRMTQGQRSTYWCRSCQR